jgi:hypothetical protein
MDTRYWGPSGWQMLHLIATQKLQKNNERHRRILFESLKDVLPCRFCRESTAAFMQELPYDEHDPGRWLWRLHNKVNAKLRGQHAKGEIVGSDPPPPDPSYEEVQARYKALLQLEVPDRLPGQDFLCALLYNFPRSDDPDSSFSDRVARKAAYDSFWGSLSEVFPFSRLREAARAHTRLEDGVPPESEAILKWGHAWIRAVCKAGKMPSPFSSFKSLCMTCAFYKSKCNGKTYRGKTCRAVKRSAPKAGLAKTVRIKPRDPEKVRAFVRSRLLAPRRELADSQ